MKPCKTLSKHLPKGEKSFYKFLLIISNVGSTYFEILKCQFLFIYLFFKNEDFSEIFSKKSYMQIIEPFLLAFSSKKKTLGFNLSPNLGCKKKNKTQ
jgi:hypothetical protein